MADKPFRKLVPLYEKHLWPFYGFFFGNLISGFELQRLYAEQSEFSCKDVIKESWSKLIQGLEDQCLSFTGNQFINGLPCNPFDKRPA